MVTEQCNCIVAMAIDNRTVVLSFCLFAMVTDLRQAYSEIGNNFCDEFHVNCLSAAKSHDLLNLISVSMVPGCAFTICILSNFPCIS